MRQSLRLVGDGDSSQLELGLSQSIFISFDKNTEHHINMIISVCVVFMCVLICAGVTNYITTLPLLSGAASGLQAEDSLLEFHQLTPQGVLLSQDVGDHGLGLVSGQVRLEARELFIFTSHLTHFTENQLHKACLVSYSCRPSLHHGETATSRQPQWLNLSHATCNSKRGHAHVSVRDCLNEEISIHCQQGVWYAGCCQCGICGCQLSIF